MFAKQNQNRREASCTSLKKSIMKLLSALPRSTAASMMNSLIRPVSPFLNQLSIFNAPSTQKEKNTHSI